MNVMLLVPALEEGGVERHVVSLASGLSKDGHAVWVVSSGGAMAERLPKGVRHVTMPVHRKNPLAGMRCALRIARLARAHDIRTLHAHSRVPAWICLLARPLSGARFVFTAHARYSLNLGLWPLSRADGVICVSGAVKEHLAGRLPRSAPVEVIYNALTDDVPPWKGGTPSGEGARRLLYLGRLAPKKGPMVLLEALALLRRAGETGWRLDVVGEGPMRGELERRAGETDLSGMVRFHGHSDEGGKWMARCDLFCFPSLDEGMGLALLEALASGVPTLASKLPAVQEIVSGTGLLPPGDARAWAEAIGRYLRKEAVPKLAPSITLPSPNEMARAVERFYRKASDRPSKRKRPGNPPQFR